MELGGEGLLGVVGVWSFGDVVDCVVGGVGIVDGVGVVNDFDVFYNKRVGEVFFVYVGVEWIGLWDVVEKIENWLVVE